MVESKSWELEELTSLTWRLCRAIMYLVGGVIAMLVVNDGFPTPAPAVVGICGAAVICLYWLLLIYLVFMIFKWAPVGFMLAFTGVFHVGVLAWCWFSAGPGIAVPLFFGCMGLTGVTSSVAQIRPVLRSARA
ncbi:hypothetical protein [Glycomyces harbinensis]|uniref:Uncharacterized protein n=1 Tax=Glycomyces harbinensis TaxID=58114 RepID=A0A1G6XK86_9ACTN|nr:hypothetical protein [Glycomyces harbinensis]SDD78203.1 hypothetical protein SAMN05216270_107203 [Glycomyces harbinensis]